MAALLPDMAPACWFSGIFLKLANTTYLLAGSFAATNIAQVVSDQWAGMIGRFEQFNIFGFRCESRVHNLLGEKGESLWLLSIFSLAAILWNINQNPLLTLFSYLFNQHFVFIS